MPTHTSLASLFTDIANAIRAKTGGSSSIVADNFPSAIASIPSGGGGSTLGTKTITQNGTYYASSDGFDGYSSVVVNVSGGGGGSTWTVTNLAAPAESDDTFLAYQASGISNDIGAVIVYSTAARTPQANKVVSILYDSNGGKMSYFNSSGSAFMSSNGVSVFLQNGGLIVDITNTGMTFFDTNYGIIVVHGGTGSLTFRNTNTTPNSSQTQAGFTVTAAPKLYLCALYNATAYASAHRVQTVTFMDDTTPLIRATNFYTSNQGYYSSGFTSTLSGTTLTIASNGSNAGGWFHNDVYMLYYLTDADLA